MSICTYAVFGSKPIYQEGFSMNQGKNRIKVCGSCAKVLRSEITSKSSISSFVCGSRKTNKCGQLLLILYQFTIYHIYIYKY